MAFCLKVLKLRLCLLCIFFYICSCHKSFSCTRDHSYANLFATARFRSENPKLFGAIVAALKEAERIIEGDRRAAIADWLLITKSKLPLDVAAKVLDEPGTSWTLTPQRVMQFARFMHGMGVLTQMPATWQDVYFPDAVGDRPGS